MKLSRKAIKARRTVLKMFPSSILHYYIDLSNCKRFGIFVFYDKPKKTIPRWNCPSYSNEFWLEVNKENSPNAGKAWIEAEKAVHQEMLKMLEF